MRVRERFFAFLLPVFCFQGAVGEALILSMGLGFAADPTVSRRGQAAGFGYLPVKRSPLTNMDENGKICSKSVEFAQSFIKSLRVWEMVGDLGRIWLAGA